MCSCKENPDEKVREQLFSLLESNSADSVSRYAIVNKIADNILTSGDRDGFILFMTAYAYMTDRAEPVAEYYFDRILRTYRDLEVKGNSIHFMCLQNLIQISKTPRSRITYFNELINRFPAKVSITELYLRLALEYEKESEWDEALKSYSMFLAQPDASTIQIAGEPNAYKKARQLVGFSSSVKNWTFESLPALESAVKTAIKN